MEIKTTERVVSPNAKSVFISPNLIRESEMLDKHGNVIDPVTKQIIRKADKE